MKKVFLIIYTVAISVNLYSQDCNPAIISKDSTIEYYGGTIRGAESLFSDDKTSYSFYIAQIEKGKKETFAVASLFESIENRKEYNNAIRDYLNQTSLNKSYISISFNDSEITIPSTSCTVTPESSLGSIYGYTISFQGNMTKEMIVKLQNNPMLKFKFVVGNKPYEKMFKSNSKKVVKLQKAMNCVELTNFFELKKKKPSELNLNEVSEDNYSTEIIGKWVLQTNNNLVLEFNSQNQIIIYNSGNIISEGTYKILKNRLIYTGTIKSGSSIFELFLKDMIILKENGKEYTYERI